MENGWPGANPLLGPCRPLFEPVASGAMSDHGPLLRSVAEHATKYLDSLDERPIYPRVTAESLRRALGGPLPERGRPPGEVIDALVAAAEPGVVAMSSGRYFGFVIGGAVPAALAADWLTSTWDQNAGLYAGGPSAAVVEEVCQRWLVELFGLPAQTSVGFVTGCQMAHVTALAAARGELLRRAGWNLEEQGLAGSPRLRVLVGELRHVTVDRALRLLGIGSAQLEPVAVDDAGRTRADALEQALARGSGPTLVCAQVGEVNTGACDPLPRIAATSKAHGAWLHVDGAFGLWAAASPSTRHLVEGLALADSWATDAHKWLNVPYDSGLAFCAHPEAHRAAMTTSASYLIQEGKRDRDAVDWVPEFSRRARAFPIYAALRSLGKEGVRQMVDRCCSHARRFAEALARVPGVEVLNDVVLNQVLLRIGDDAKTDEVQRRVQESGEAWMSGTKWRGRRALRISVSNWSTTEQDVDRTLEALRRALA